MFVKELEITLENGMKISEALNLTIEELYNKIYNLKEEK